MHRKQKLILTGLSVIVANNALADGSLNGLKEIVYIIIITTGILLILLAISISLILNFLVFRKKRSFVGTAVGAFILSLIPTILNGVGDYNSFITISVVASSLIGGLLGYLLTTRWRKASS